MITDNDYILPINFVGKLLEWLTEFTLFLFSAFLPAVWRTSKHEQVGRCRLTQKFPESELLPVSVCGKVRLFVVKCFYAKMRERRGEKREHLKWFTSCRVKGAKLLSISSWYYFHTISSGSERWQFHLLSICPSNTFIQSISQQSWPVLWTLVWIFMISWKMIANLRIAKISGWISMNTVVDINVQWKILIPVL